MATPRWFERLCGRVFDEEALGISLVLMTLAFGVGTVVTFVLYLAVANVESFTGLR
jgi:hypothetical protein